MECFDISHTAGKQTVGSCVVFVKGLAQTSQYRQFNIKDITPGDDYAAMRQVVYRRYLSLSTKNKPLPDLVFIDGGLGQLNQALMVLDSIGIDTIKLVGVAKGAGRKAGLETLITIKNGLVQKINLAPHDLTLRFINHVRDESHRFAIKNHRLLKAKEDRQISLLKIKGDVKDNKINVKNKIIPFDNIKKARTYFEF